MADPQLDPKELLDSVEHANCFIWFCLCKVLCDAPFGGHEDFDGTSSRISKVTGASLGRALVGVESLANLIHKAPIAVRSRMISAVALLTGEILRLPDSVQVEQAIIRRTTCSIDTLAGLKGSELGAESAESKAKRRNYLGHAHYWLSVRGGTDSQRLLSTAMKLFSKSIDGSVTRIELGVFQNLFIALEDLFISFPNSATKELQPVFQFLSGTRRDSAFRKALVTASLLQYPLLNVQRMFAEAGHIRLYDHQHMPIVLEPNS